jgi:hypothetical protein
MDEPDSEINRLKKELEAIRKKARILSVRRQNA